jgi:hypothetical protein
MSGHPGPGAGQPDPVAAGEPPAVPRPERTGHATVDAALRAVAEVADAPPSDQLPAYQAVHRTLRETLASIDED